MSRRKAARLVDFLAGIAVLWAFMAIIPAEVFWFNPGRVVVEDTEGGRPPVIDFDRTIRKDVRMKYQVVIRSVSGTPICDPASGAFTYRRASELPEVIDLVWWTGADPRCWPQEPGTYLMETCWTVVSPFWGLVPPKSVCRESPPFHVREG